jgi:enoyl-[acyl-carrier protein] reductase II
MKTRITEILGIEYPILQGGMAWVAEHNLAAAVSEAGGLGIIGAGGAPAEFVREQIQKVKEVTDKPFGVNIMLMNPEADAIAQVVVDEGVRVVTTGAGNPSKYMEMWKAAGVKVIPVVASVAMAKLMQRGGADAVVAEGMESGGHIGAITTMALVPQIADAVEIPVVAAAQMAEDLQQPLCSARRQCRSARALSWRQNLSYTRSTRQCSSNQRISTRQSLA